MPEIHFVHPGIKLDRHHRIATATVASVSNFFAINLQTESVVRVADEGDESGFADKDLACAEDGKVIVIAWPVRAIHILLIPKRVRA